MRTWFGNEGWLSLSVAWFVLVFVAVPCVVEVGVVVVVVAAVGLARAAKSVGIMGRLEFGLDVEMWSKLEGDLEMRLGASSVGMPYWKR